MRDKPVQDLAQQNNKIDRQALRDLARSRIDGLAGRVAFYVLGAAIGAAVVPTLWVALCLGLIAVAEFAEHHAARALLAADGHGANAAESRRANALAVAHIATASAVALALAAIWVFTGPVAKILPLCLLAIVVLDGARAGHQVYVLMMLRQALYLGTAVAMTLRDIALKAISEVAFRSQAGGQNLDGHIPAQFGVPGAVHLTHAANTDLGLDFVMEQCLADHGAPLSMCEVSKWNYHTNMIVVFVVAASRPNDPAVENGIARTTTKNDVPGPSGFAIRGFGYQH